MLILLAGIFVLHLIGIVILLVATIDNVSNPAQLHSPGSAGPQGATDPASRPPSTPSAHLAELQSYVRFLCGATCFTFLSVRNTSVFNVSQVVPAHSAHTRGTTRDSGALHPCISALHFLPLAFKELTVRCFFPQAWWMTETISTDMWGRWLLQNGVWNLTDLPSGSTYPQGEST